MAQLTARETIEHHIDMLATYLETAPTVEASGADKFAARYTTLVDEFWDEYKNISLAYGTTYYWMFSQACGENETVTLSYYGEDAWPVRAVAIAQRMRTSALEKLYLMTTEAGVPEEYLNAMVLEMERDS